MLTRCVSTIIAAAIAAILSAPAQAQDNIESKAALCAACHGANGVPTDPKTTPNIWGQQPYYILQQLVQYRNGTREHPIMSAIAKTLQPGDLRPLAAYFAAKSWPGKAAAATPPSPPKQMAMCVPCHQQNFEGGISWPRIAGLNYDYLVGAMRSFAKEERTTNTDMVQFMKLFSDSDRDAMAHYLAGL
jgi:cytochrome c553